MIIADTGFWLALASPKDKHHARAVEALQNLKEPLITSWPVITETCHLLLRRRGERAQRKFLVGYANAAYQVFALKDEHAPRIVELVDKYADLSMDLADASLVILAEHLRHGRILSTDQRDFRTYRWKQHEPFENMLL